MAALSPLLLLGGCLGEERDHLLVEPGPYGPVPRQTPVRAGYAAAAEAEAKRVLAVAQKVIDANPQIGLRPVFITIGAPQPEIFHQGGDGPGKPCQVYVSEGLARQCKTEAELAAVLCQELGKVVVERTSMGQPGASRPGPLPPPGERLGNDERGPFGSADGTRLAELAKWEKQRGAAGKPRALPAPEELARGYLKRARFDPRELDRVAGLLRQAEDHADLETSIKGQPTRR
jgi:hypothetical protein